MRFFRSSPKQKWYDPIIVFACLWFIWQVAKLGMPQDIACFSQKTGQCVFVMSGDYKIDCDAFAESTIEEMERIWVE